MPDHITSRPTSGRARWRRLGAGALAAVLLGSSAACSETDSSTADAAERTASSSELALFDSSTVHDIDISFDEDAYADMIETFETTGDKEWISATVTIDGTTLDEVGLRLKGNSSLFDLSSETSGNPEDLPWLIRFDKFVDEQSYQGYDDLVIRSNSTETAMNEAVALELLGLAGLATQEAIATSFTVNGGETELRLAIEHPDKVWYADNFGAEATALYKADSEGDYSYRGDDPDAYDDVFDQKAGDDDLAPLIDFLDFVNNSDDATFAAELADHLDVEAFATYLAAQDLIGNFDDIDGRGNNSYLSYSADTGRFTVVAWDHNLAFATPNVGVSGPGRGGFRPDGGPPDGAPGPDGGPPDGAPGPGGGPPDGAPGPDGGPQLQGANVVADRFRVVDEFMALIEGASAELSASLYDSGAAAEIIDDWSATLIDEAAGLVDEATVTAEAQAIVDYIEEQG